MYNYSCSLRTKHHRRDEIKMYNYLSSLSTNHHRRDEIWIVKKAREVGLDQDWFDVVESNSRAGTIVLELGLGFLTCYGRNWGLSLTQLTKSSLGAHLFEHEGQFEQVLLFCLGYFFILIIGKTGWIDLR